MLAVLLLGLGCQDPAPPPPASAEDTAGAAFTISHQSVDFGAVAVGEIAWREVVIHNEGAVEVLLLEARLDGAGLEAELDLNTGGNDALAPGETQSVFLTWAPSAAGALEAELTLRLEADGDQERALPLTGTAQAAQPGLSTSALDFGQVALGCSGSAEVQVTNHGALPATVAALLLSGDAAFALEDPPALPWTVAPGEPLALALTYTPERGGRASGALEVRLDQTLTLTLQGDGVAGDARVDSFLVEGGQPVTLLLGINGELTPGGPWGDRTEEALPALFETLGDAGVPWRVAWLVEEDGTVVGDVPYIDDSFTTDQAVAAALGMLAGASEYDNDYMFDTLYSALLENRGWVIDDPEWAESRLNLVAISNDLEQSPINYVSFLENCGALKDGIAVHAIGGPYPTGCPDAAPYAGVYEATLETGGIFLDLCEESWIGHMEALALASLGGNQSSFPLSAAPATSTLEVWVDGVEAPTGWAYNELVGAVVFDRPLDQGAAVELRYQERLDCVE